MPVLANGGKDAVRELVMNAEQSDAKVCDLILPRVFSDWKEKSINKELLIAA